MGRKKRPSHQKLRRVYYCHESPFQAFDYGICFCCGELLINHPPSQRRSRELGWYDPINKKEMKIDLPVAITGHHIRFQELRRQESNYPDDYQNVVWVAQPCHDEFHDVVRHILQEMGIFRLTPAAFDRALSPLNYGRALLKRPSISEGQLQHSGVA